jgi:hypothetical protein
MDPAYLDYLLFAATTFAVGTLGFAVAWLRARERAIRAETRLSSGTPASLGAGIETRFDRLEQIAEDTALELERLAEAQRFQSKILAGRSAEGAPRHEANPARVITPH